jgi:FkbM family methyltransferase
MAPLKSLTARAARRLIGPYVPARWSLRFRHRLALFEGCESELRYLARLGPNRGIAIDVGANEGLYTYGLSRLYSAVHAFEINPELAAWLRSRAPGNVTVHPMGLSSAAGTGELFIPVVRDKALTGWASLSPDNCPGAERWIRQPVQFQSLDALDLTDVAFIKADVEGHEPQFLSGALETIRRNRPVVLLEVKDMNRAKVQAFFAGLNYRERSFVELSGVNGSVENMVFVPET